MTRVLRNGAKAFASSSYDTRVSPTIAITTITLLMPALFGDLLPYNIRNIMFSVGCVVAIGYLFSHKNYNILNIGIGFGWLLFALFAVSSRLISGGEMGFAQIALLLAAITLCCSTCSTGWFRTVLLCMLVLLAVHLIATLLFYAIPDLYSKTVKAWFFTDNRNAVGYQSGLTAHYSNNGLMMATGFLLASSYAMGSDKGGRGGWAALSAVFLFALILTQKRAHLIFAIFAIIITYSISNFKGKTLKIALACSAAFIALVFIATFVPGVALSLDRLFGTFATSDIAESTTGRTYLWAAAIAGWLESPYIGNGWGSFLYFWPGGNTSIYAHNEILQLLNDVGIIGLSSFSILAIASLRIAYGNIKEIGKAKGVLDANYRSAAFFSFSYQTLMLSYACTTGGLLQAPIDFVPYFFAVALCVPLASFLKTRTKEALCDA